MAQKAPPLSEVPCPPPPPLVQAFGRLLVPEQLYLVEAALKLPPLVEQLHERLGNLRSFNPSNPTGESYNSLRLPPGPTGSHSPPVYCLTHKRGGASGRSLQHWILPWR